MLNKIGIRSEDDLRRILSSSYGLDDIEGIFNENLDPMVANITRRVTYPLLIVRLPFFADLDEIISESIIKARQLLEQMIKFRLSTSDEAEQIREITDTYK